MENNLLLINANLFISLSSSAAENFESLYVRNFVNEISTGKKRKKEKCKQTTTKNTNTNTKKQRRVLHMHELSILQDVKFCKLKIKIHVLEEQNWLNLPCLYSYMPMINRLNKLLFQTSGICQTLDCSHRMLKALTYTGQQ